MTKKKSYSAQNSVSSNGAKSSSPVDISFKDGDFKNHILNEKNIYITEKYINSIFKKYKIIYKVKNLEIFQLAMIHISYLNRANITHKTSKILTNVVPISNDDKHNAIPLYEKDYGRLEYLGDAVIHSILAKYLFDRYKNEDEGFLTKLRTKLEKAETLSELSKKIGLDKYAIIARNIEQSYGRINNIHLTEDIFEAFFGALFTEAGYDICDKLLINIIECEIDIAELLFNNDNYKDRLNKHFHQMKWSDPKYYEDISQQEIIKEGCQEIIIFTTYVKNQNGEIIGIGRGNSKIKAEQNTALNALITLGIISDDDNKSDYYGEITDDKSICSSENDPVESDHEIIKNKYKSIIDKSYDSDSFENTDDEYDFK